jgi:site-specific recombinase XerC
VTADVLEDWRRWCEVSRGLSAGTIAAYAREVRALDNPVTAGPNELRAELHRRGGAPATVARRIAAWRSFYGWLVRTDQRTDDPTDHLDRPKVRPGLPRPVEDLDAVLDLLHPTDQAIAVFLAETGLRISEACGVSATPPVPDQLLVHGKGDKDRLLPLTDLARAALDELGGRLPASARTIQRRFREVGISPHRLRHHLGCELAASGADLGEIQDILGHASPATTRVYAAYGLDRLRKAQGRR